MIRMSFKSGSDLNIIKQQYMMKILIHSINFLLMEVFINRDLIFGTNDFVFFDQSIFEQETSAVIFHSVT